MLRQIFSLIHALFTKFLDYYLLNVYFKIQFES